MERSVDNEYMMFLLNTLGQAYNSGSGFDFYYDVYYLKNNKYFEDFIDFIDEAFAKNYKVMDSEENKYQRKSEITSDYIMFDLEFLKKKSQIPVTFKTIILKYDEGYWTYGKPHKISKPNRVYEWYKADFKTRPYIKVNDPFMKITISAQEKGSAITIDDILFATRGMALDNSRIITVDGGYEIVSSLGTSMIVLRPCMDNMST